MCFRPCWPREAAVQCHSRAALSPSGMLTRTPPSAPLHPSSLPLPHSPATALPHLQAQRRRPTGHSLPQGGQPCPGGPDWAPAPWHVPGSSGTAAGLVARLLPDLGYPGSLLRPPFSVLAKLGGPSPGAAPAAMAWPQPTGLGVPAPRWGWQCCHFWGVLPGLWEGARFGVFLHLAVLSGLGGGRGLRCAPGLGGLEVADRFFSGGGCSF